MIYSRNTRLLKSNLVYHCTMVRWQIKLAHATPSAIAVMQPSKASHARLSGSTIADAAGGVDRPAYDRGGLASGIVHLGLGAFHRAHQALYTEAAVQQGDLRWGIVGVSLRDPRVARTLAAQDHLYSVTERHGDEARTRVVGVLADALHAPSALQQRHRRHRRPGRRPWSPAP